MKRSLTKEKKNEEWKANKGFSYCVAMFFYEIHGFVVSVREDILALLGTALVEEQDL
jgi:hypothetical protein